MPTIPNSRVLIIATDGFEEWELFGPRQILQERGAEVVLASLKLDPIQATVHDDPGKTIRPDLTVDQASADDFDALILPGGVRNPDQLRLHDNVIELIRDFDDQGKPIGAICHGPWLLIEADLLDGRTATSWPSIRTDLRNAGANVVDEPAVTDGNIVTSRKPDDVEAFTKALIDLIEDRARDDRSRGDGRNRRLTDWKPIACIGPGMDTGLIERIESGTARGASALFAGAVGYAAYGLAAAAGIEPRLAALRGRGGGAGLFAVQPLARRSRAHGPHSRCRLRGSRFRICRGSRRAVADRAPDAADELVLTDADRLDPRRLGFDARAAGTRRHPGRNWSGRAGRAAVRPHGDARRAADSGPASITHRQSSGRRGVPISPAQRPALTPPRLFRRRLPSYGARFASRPLRSAPRW